MDSTTDVIRVVIDSIHDLDPGIYRANDTIVYSFITRDYINMEDLDKLFSRVCGDYKECVICDEKISYSSLADSLCKNYDHAFVHECLHHPEWFEDMDFICCECHRKFENNEH